MTAMTFRICNAVIALGCLLAASSAWAHHSTTAVFDFDKRVTLTGTLTKVDWRNPHTEFTLEAKGDTGQAESWLIESISPSSWARRKVTKADFEKAIGQTVTVEVSPARDGPRFVLLRRMTFADGKSVAPQ